MRSLFLSFVAISLSVGFSTAQNCRCTVLESCWPSDETWSQLNTTVSGRLIKSTPLAKPCHAPDYDEDTCAALQTNWDIPAIHISSTSSMQYPLFAGDTCSPFTDINATCGLGKEVLYAINITGPSDVAAGIAFAKKHNIRLVIRNTGHDLLGKSTGYSALALWTHNLKSQEWMDSYDGPGDYHGPAVKLGSGVQGFEAYLGADAHNRTVVGGECSTVGLAGGYIAGGGHSGLGSLYGLAADQALAFEAVTANGEFVVANSANNSDLKWALSGGGAGTYAVVLSVTIKTHDPVMVSAAQLGFNNSNVDNDTFWEGVASYMPTVNKYTDRGGFSSTVLTATSFFLEVLFMPKHTIAQIQELIQPTISKLEELKIPYTTNFTTYSTYLEANNAMLAAQWRTSGDTQTGSRLIPRPIVDNDPDKFMATVRSIAEDGANFFDTVLSPTREVVGNISNAVLPAWRTASRHLVPWGPYNSTESPGEISTVTNKVTNNWVAALRELAPDSGAYLNEADPNEPDWQTAFYGANYQTLLSIKKKYDPDNIFYAKTAVGSEAWTELSDGRLCASTY